jgi:hypothetical protein
MFLSFKKKEKEDGYSTILMRSVGTEMHGGTVVRNVSISAGTIDR